MIQGQTQELEKCLRYTFKNTGLFKQALTHRSAAGPNNERLEFLGDAILNVTIAEALYERFESASEGVLSRLRASLVQEATLASLAREFELGDHLILGQGEMKSGGFRRASILSDAIEALIGAIRLDADMRTAQACVLDWFSTRLASVSLEQNHKDAKTELQEWLQSRSLALPQYDLLDTNGQAHQQQFKVSCSIQTKQKAIKTVTAIASNRKKAEKDAAEQMLRLLGVRDQKIYE